MATKKAKQTPRQFPLGDEGLGVFDDRQIYNQHAIARIMGLALGNGECSKFVLRKLFHAELPFAKIGRQYLVSGRVLNRWVEARSKTWEEQIKK